MNMWGMTPEFLQELDRGFRDFFRRGEEELDKTEFLIPIFVDQLLQEEGRFPCGSFPRRTGGLASPIGRTSPRWQRPSGPLIAAGEYGADLFAGLRPV